MSRLSYGEGKNADPSTQDHAPASACATAATRLIREGTPAPAPPEVARWRRRCSAADRQCPVRGRL